MQLYALLQFPHWEAHSSSLPPHPQRSTWCQRGLWQSQDLLLLCCSHQASLRGLLIHCFTGLHQPSHLWLPEKHCHHLSAAWGSQGKAKGGAPMAFCLLTLSKWALKLPECSSPVKPKDSLGHSSGSSLQMPTAPSCETLTAQDQQDSPVGSTQSQAQMTLEVSWAEMTGMLGLPPISALNSTSRA